VLLDCPRERVNEGLNVSGEAVDPLLNVRNVPCIGSFEVTGRVARPLVSEMHLLTNDMALRRIEGVLRRSIAEQLTGTIKRNRDGDFHSLYVDGSGPVIAADAQWVRADVNLHRALLIDIDLICA
jgi:hypothetical protein